MYFLVLQPLPFLSLPLPSLSPYSACPNTSLRLFIIGHYHKGKTTLLAKLRGKLADTSFDHRNRRIHSESEDGPLHLSDQGWGEKGEGRGGEGEERGGEGKRKLKVYKFYRVLVSAGQVDYSIVLQVDLIFLHVPVYPYM